MLLDKILDPEQFMPTHKSTILSLHGNPITCIIDSNPQNESRYL